MGRGDAASKSADSVRIGVVWELLGDRYAGRGQACGVVCHGVRGTSQGSANGIVNKRLDQEGSVAVGARPPLCVFVWRGPNPMARRQALR